MHRSTRSHSVLPILLVALAATLVASPVAGYSSPPSAAGPDARSADLSMALRADGTFRGTPGLAGTVDASAWTMVSDLAAGEPPRFAPATDSPVKAATTTMGRWSNLGSNGHGGGALHSDVNAMVVSGNDLYVGGSFTNAAGLPKADYIARWNGSRWLALGSNSHGDGALNQSVEALAVSGHDLYVGGAFTNVDHALDADYVVKWNGSTWSAMGSDHAGDGALNNYVNALAILGHDLYVGGSFTNAAGLAKADDIAKWNVSTWSALGSNGASDGALDSQVNALAVSGGDLYVGGAFHNAGGIAEADFVAFWTGDAWQALDSNGAGDGALNDSVYTLLVSRGDLFAAGVFTDAAGIATADYVAKWSGSHWSALGSDGAGGGALDHAVYALAMSGDNLYAGGYFLNAAGIPPADRIARWNGSTWSALGSDGHGDGAVHGYVFALAVSGNNLYVGGYFSNTAGIPTADNVALWGLGSHRKPDGRIRLGAGTLVGNDVYGTTGAGQSRTGSAARGHAISFGISVQNDGTSSDRIKVKATGTAATGYTVSYFRGASDITAAVVAGSYTTPSLAPGATFLITAEVNVKSHAAAGSRVTRLVTLTSVGDSARKDAIKLIGKRA